MAGPSPAKKAFLASMGRRIDFSSIGKVSVSQLVPSLQRSTFRARLLFCTRGISQEKKMTFLSLVFLDGTGEIKATVWRENLDFWQQRLVIYEIYDVSLFTVTPSDQRYSRLTSKFQIMFEKNTKVNIFCI